MSDTATKEDIQRLDKKVGVTAVGLKADIQKLDKKIDDSFSRLDKKIDNAFDDLTSLLRTFMEQVDDRFRRIEEEQRQIRADINRLFDYMDKIAKKQEISDQERLVVGHQLERLDRWTHELANKIGYTLST
jgi:chromosome segregation ATPase